MNGQGFVLRSLLVTFGLAAIAGCAGMGDVHSTAERYLARDGMVQVSAVRPQQTTEGLEIISYGRSGGDREVMVRLEELDDLATVTSDWGTLILSATPEERPTIEQALWTEEAESLQKLLDVVEDTLHHAMSALPGLSRQGVDVRVLLTTYDSGRAIEYRHLVDDSAVALGLISPVVVPDGEKSFANPNISVMTMRVASVLLRAEYSLGGRRYGTVNQWAADNLFKRCVQSRFAMATGVSVTISYNDEYESWPGFPGLQEGKWAPRVDDFPVRNPQQRGDYLAGGWLYHATDRQVSLDLSDAEAVAPLLELCDRLGSDVPDFLRGETGLNSSD